MPVSPFIRRPIWPLGSRSLDDREVRLTLRHPKTHQVASEEAQKEGDTWIMKAAWWPVRGSSPIDYPWDIRSRN
jgi:hypothetical protein